MKVFLFAAAAMIAMAAPAAASTVFVGTDPDAPTSNFDTPGNTATAGYSLSLSDDGTNVVGSVVQTGGVSAGQFANLYFDLNPTVMDGSDLGFEIGGTGVTAFIPGKNGQAGFSTLLDPSAYSVLTGVPGTVSFTLANSLFTGPIAGLAYYGPADGSPPQTFESDITLRLSQSLSYSVAGGASYGPNRLGSVTVGSASAAVPEPATWAMMLVGFGLTGAALRRRRRVIATA